MADPDSALLRHDAAFCLGQRGSQSALPALEAVLRRPGEHPMVRHEAAEAAGALGGGGVALLKEFASDASREVAETCRLALARTAWLETGDGDGDGGDPAAPAGAHPRFLSVDPAPPARADTPLETLTTTLLDDAAPIFDRYRALFSLRDDGGEAAVAALCSALRAAGPSTSALLKHEVAYVLGQLQSPASLPALRDALANAGEHGMVRHEAAEALGALGAAAAAAPLAAALADSDPVVAQSAAVALDVLGSEAGGEFEYASVVAAA
jgi:deoxyhypusine monooxygenase